MLEVGPQSRSIGCPVTFLLSFVSPCTVWCVCLTCGLILGWCSSGQALIHADLHTGSVMTMEGSTQVRLYQPSACDFYHPTSTVQPRFVHPPLPRLLPRIHHRTEIAQKVSGMFLPYSPTKTQKIGPSLVFLCPRCPKHDSPHRETMPFNLAHRFGIGGKYMPRRLAVRWKALRK